MATISYEDTIMATVQMGYRTLANVKASGFSSLADVVNYIRSLIGRTAGMVSLRVRNASRGWSTQTMLYIAPMAVGTQLTLNL